jgi:outer membrane biosynthesis protein TonB
MKTNANCRFGRMLGVVLAASVFLCVGFAEDTPKKVTKADGLNAATNKVAPAYPPVARQLKIEGSVELEALVTESGAVLTRPAVDAVKKWKFAPFTDEGKVVKALVPVSLSFHM